MDINSYENIFTPPENSTRDSDGEYYWSHKWHSARTIYTWAYSKCDDGRWIVGYHTLGSRECYEPKRYYFNEIDARLNWILIKSQEGLPQYIDS
jgi:hypothetical protein